MMTRWQVTALLITALITAVVFLVGCADNSESPTTTDSESPTTTDSESPTATDSEYIRATATKNGISFSFEYPASYVKPTPDAFEDTGDDPSVSLLYAITGSAIDKADKQIFIRACDPLPSRPDAANWTEEHLKLLEKNDSAYKLIGRSTIQVAGIDGQMAAYHSSILGHLSSAYLTSYDAYIDYQGYIWKITVTAIEAIADQVEPDFEHLIQSFEFLN